MNNNAQCLRLVKLCALGEIEESTQAGKWRLNKTGNTVLVLSRGRSIRDCIYHRHSLNTFKGQIQLMKFFRTGSDSRSILLKYFNLYLYFVESHDRSNLRPSLQGVIYLFVAATP